MDRQTKHIPTCFVCRNFPAEQQQDRLEVFGGNDCNVLRRHRRVRRAISGSNDSKHGAGCEDVAVPGNGNDSGYAGCGLAREAGGRMLKQREEQ